MLTGTEGGGGVDLQNDAIVAGIFLPSGLDDKAVADGQGMEELLPVIRPVLLVHVGEGDLQRAQIKLSRILQSGDAGEDLFLLELALLVAGKVDLYLHLAGIGKEGILDVIKGNGFFLDDFV